MIRNEPEMTWPASDFTRIPLAAYHDSGLYDREQDLIFRGPTWNYLALEAELPAPGDFRTTVIGDAPVLVNRGTDGTMHAMVNRCAHRGATVRREMHGNAESHTCCYHQWCYDLQGDLISVPYRRGINGKGGLPADFDYANHSMRKLRVESYRGVIFGSFSEETEPLAEYLDAPITEHLDRLMHKPLRILGYQRQQIFGNWKLYTDNVRDPNHGGLLHMFQIKYGLARLSQWGGAKLDKRQRHNISYTSEDTTMLVGKDEYDGMERGDTTLRLADPSFLRNRDEYPDEVTLSILSIFPNCVFHQISNSLATRQIRTRGPGEFELFWTYYGYEDDDESMTNHRLRQANMAGPGGYISMEDGEAIEIAHRAGGAEKDVHSVVEIGGRGKVTDQDNLVTEAPMRGFWAYYADLMNIQPARA